MKKQGIARIGDMLSNVAAGKLGSLEYQRQSIPKWDVQAEEYVLLSNVNIIDVNLGQIGEERGVLIRHQRIEALIAPNDLEQVRHAHPIAREIDGQNQYLIPGLSDLHGHLSLISEFDMSLAGLRFFDHQRQKNCEEALKAGCTFVRDSGGAYTPVSYLQREIEADRLLGPKILPSYEVMSPKGGMWDINPVMNYLARMVFGGNVVNYLSTDQDIRETVTRLHDMGCGSFKTYFEDKPLYGRTANAVYKMFTPEQARLFRSLADQHAKPLEAHAMFIKGVRRVIDARFDSIAHMTVDAPYSPDDARNMAKNHTAVVPTLSLGCYLAMNCGPHGNPEHPEYTFFEDMLNRYVPPQIERCTVPEIRHTYTAFRDWLNQELPDRKMPAVGTVYPERVHGFAKHVRESFRNFQDAGATVGMGTDGGTGITFVGQLEVEFEAYQRFGYSSAQTLRMATLGNMEILQLDNELGSIMPGKYADLVLLGRNPLEDPQAIQHVRLVMKNGRVYYEKKRGH